MPETETKPPNRSLGLWLFGFFLMGAGGVLAGYQVLDQRLQRAAEIADATALHRLVQDYAAFRDELRGATQRTRERLHDHQLAYENLRSGRMSIGMRGAVNRSILNLDAPAALPTPPFDPIQRRHDAARGGGADHEILRALAEVERQVQNLQRLSDEFEPVRRQIGAHLLGAVAFRLNPGDDGAPSNPEVDYSFASLASDRLLLNYYFRVLQFQQQWLAAAERLLSQLDALAQHPLPAAGP